MMELTREFHPMREAMSFYTGWIDFTSIQTKTLRPSGTTTSYQTLPKKCKHRLVYQMRPLVVVVSGPNAHLKCLHDAHPRRLGANELSRTFSISSGLVKKMKDVKERRKHVP